MVVFESTLNFVHLHLKVTYNVDPFEKVHPSFDFHLILDTSSYSEDEHFIQKYFDHEN